MFVINRLWLICTLFLIVINNVTAQAETTWQKPTPIFSQKFDWLKLTSDEWLKGDIISMYDDELEFDSDKFGVKFFDWEDVSELRSRFDQKIRLSDDRIVQGFLIVKNNQLTLISAGTEQQFSLSELLSITSAADNRKELWDAKITLGIDISQGNTNQLDYLLTAKAQRSTPTNRFKTDFIFNYSESSDDNSTKITVNSRRLNVYFDWFYDADIFFRVVDWENYSDLQQNINESYSLGSSLGYHAIKTKRIEWDATLGPSYQVTNYNGDTQSKSEKSAALSLSTLYEYKISSQIDFTLDYQVQFVSDEAGARIHHLKTGFEFEFIDDLDIDILFYFDRVAKPISSSSNVTPQPNDYRLALSVGYHF